MKEYILKILMWVAIHIVSAAAASGFAFLAKIPRKNLTQIAFLIAGIVAVIISIAAIVVGAIILVKACIVLA